MALLLRRYDPLRICARAYLSTTTRRGGPRTRSGGSPSRNSSLIDRSERITSRLGNLPSLKEFVHKTTVVRQYRGFMRAVTLIPDEAFRKSALDEGGRRLEQVRSMVGYVDQESKSDSDSWMNIDDKEDPRGRVGVQWPWEHTS